MDAVSLERRNLCYSPVSNGQQKKRRIFKCFSNYWKELKARSLNIPSILLLVYAASMSVCDQILLNISTDFATPLHDHCGYIDNPDNNSLSYNIAILATNTFCILIPFCGWLSDTKIGRGNAIYLSLWLGWIGTLLQSISYCLQYNSCGITALVGRYGFSSVAFVFLFVSLAFVFTNILPFGMDQMMNVSSVKIRAFIHWSAWAYFCSNVTVYISLSVYKCMSQSGSFSIAVIGFTLVSISLCLHFNLQHHFEHIPIPNPYKIVFKVLKYSIRNNHNRRQRSAFTYWGKEPSRIDLAKERYGGSFTHEEVENVKTYFRIVAILASLCPFFIIYGPFIGEVVDIIPVFKDGNNGYAGFIFSFFGCYIVLLVLIPLYELAILPLFPKLEYFLINPLRGLGLANILILLSILSVFLIDLIGRVTNKSHDVHCYNVWVPGDPVIQVSYWILLIPSILYSTSYALTWICTFEFLCSQAPFGMHGMIIGLFWFLHSIFFVFGSGIKLSLQYHTFSSSSVLSCTSWFTIIFGLVGLVGLVVYVLTARWYVKRIRDTDLDLHTEIEQRWEQRLIRKDSYNNELSLSIN